jgi:hypothetical protein
LWTFSGDLTTGKDYIESSPLIAPDGSIYVGSSDGNLYRLNGSGSPLSTYSNWPAFRNGPQHTARSVTVSGAARVVNLSTRARANASDTVIAGFFVAGLDPKAVLLRAVGPTLQQFGVGDFMGDPRIELYAGQRPIGSNDSWEQATGGLADTAAALNAFPLPPGSKDAGLLEALQPGSYTAHVRSADTRGGVVLVEAYDAIGGAPFTRLTNVSLRNQVGTGENILIMGFVLAGAGPVRLLVRAVGPGLQQFNVSGVLARPVMTVYRNGNPIRSNAGWTTEGLTQDLVVAAQSVGAFPLPAASADSAVVLTADPGPYTVQISGMNGATGEVLSEIYVLP